MAFSPEQNKALAAKLDPSAVRQREQSGTRLAYVEGWHVIAEANRIFGFDGWTRESVELRCVSERERKVGKAQRDGWSVSYIARVRIVVFAGDSLVTREGVGAGHGIDADLGNAHESAIKESETDAMKRALSTFGNPFGLALYDKTRANVGFDEPEPEPVDWTAERDELVVLAGRCKHISQLRDLWATERMQTFLRGAPEALRTTIERLKDARKRELSPEPEMANG